MTVEQERKLKWLQEDFVPAYSSSAVPAAEHRIAAALEYIAYHIGQIDKKLTPSKAE